MKRLIGIIIVILQMLLLLSSCGIAEHQEKEPNDTYGTATPLEINGYIEGSVRTTDYDNEDTDWISFDVSAMSELDIYLSLTEGMIPKNTSWSIVVFGSDGNTEIKNYSMIGNEDTTFKLGALREGRYYIRISASHSYEDFIPYTMYLEKKHECQVQLFVSKEPTCTETGEEAERCTICGASATVREIPASGHRSDNWTVDLEPTCMGEGSRHGTCTVCNQEVTEKLSRGDHSFGAWEVVSGNIVIPPIVKEHKCAHCGYTETVKDFGYVWVTVLAVIAVIGLGVGVVSYFKAYRNP